MIDEFLPVGSVVSLKEGNMRLVITGFIVNKKDEPEVYYDYMAAPYPTGILDFEKIILFNHDQIDKIFFLGCYDEEARDFNERLIQLKKDIKNGKKVSLDNESI